VGDDSIGDGRKEEMLMFRLRSVLVGLLIAASPVLLAQDRVTTADESVLNGKFAGVSGGKLRFSEPATGEIGLDPKRVNRLTLAHPTSFWYQPTRWSLLNTGTIRGGESGDGSFVFDAVDADGNPVDPLSLYRLELNKYSLWELSGFAGASAMYSEGNSDELTYGFGLNMKLAHPVHIFELRASAAFGEKDKIRSTQRARADFSYTWRFSEAIGVYARQTFEHDDFGQLRIRSTSAVGLRAFVVDTARTSLTLDAGISWIEEHYKDGTPTRDYAAGVAGMDFSHRLTSATSVIAGTRASASLENVKYLIMNSYAGIATSLYDGLTASLRLEHDYVARPAGTAERGDTRLVFLLGWTFA